MHFMVMDFGFPALYHKNKESQLYSARNIICNFEFTHWLSIEHIGKGFKHMRRWTTVLSWLSRGEEFSIGN